MSESKDDYEDELLDKQSLIDNMKIALAKTEEQLHKTEDELENLKYSTGGNKETNERTVEDLRQQTNQSKAMEHYLMERNSKLEQMMKEKEILLNEAQQSLESELIRSGKLEVSLGVCQRGLDDFASGARFQRLEEELSNYRRWIEIKNKILDEAEQSMIESKQKYENDMEYLKKSKIEHIELFKHQIASLQAQQRSYDKIASDNKKLRDYIQKNRFDNETMRLTRKLSESTTKIYENMEERKQAQLSRISIANISQLRRSMATLDEMKQNDSL